MKNDWSFTQTVEFADEMGGGCVWHGDNECLCDVDRAKFVCGDGPYTIPQAMVDAYLDGLERPDGEWFDKHYEAMRDKTLLLSCKAKRRSEEAPTPAIAARVLEEHGDVVRRLIAGESMTALAAECGLGADALADVCRVLSLPYTGKAQTRARSAIVREAAESMAQEGMDTRQIFEALRERGADVTYGRVAQWLSRYRRQAA